jgi:hypothetical protein
MAASLAAGMCGSMILLRRPSLSNSMAQVSGS